MSLQDHIHEIFSDKVDIAVSSSHEVTITVAAGDYFSLLETLKSHAQLKFEQLIDLCAVDYLLYPQSSGLRYAVVVHLLSLTHNQRLRVLAFVPNESFPVLPSIISIWPAVDWFEREAFDLFGIIFEGHPDLRRILTDYGFIGHPFRKDFPVSGHVEVRFDEQQGRVIYQPVSIPPREIVPRIVREEHYADSKT